MTDDLWTAYREGEARLVRAGEAPCAFHARRTVIYGWCLDHLAFSEQNARTIDTNDVVRDCQMPMTEEQAKEGLEALYKEGTLKMIRERKKTLFWVDVDWKPFCQKKE